MISEDDVRKIFKGLEQGDGASFFEHVDDKVDWIVEGTIGQKSLIFVGPLAAGWQTAFNQPEEWGRSAFLASQTRFPCLPLKNFH